MKWYAYVDDGINYTMILDHNTTATIDNWDNRNNQLSLDTDGWNISLNPRLITADEIANITENKEFNASDQTSWFYFDTNNQTLSSQIPSKYGWLYDRVSLDCKKNGCLNNATGNNINDMWAYWTDTAYDNNSAWRVDGLGGLSVLGKTVNAVRGIRPVITVQKSLLNELD